MYTLKKKKLFQVSHTFFMAYKNVMNFMH